MSRSIHPEAAQGLADAALFYRQRGSARVASKFLEEFERVVDLLTGNPGFGTPFVEVLPGQRQGAGNCLGNALPAFV